MHFRHLSFLLIVLRLLSPIPSNNNKVNQLTKTSILTIPLNKTCDVLHAIQSRHCEYDGLVSVFQDTPVREQ